MKANTKRTLASVAFSVLVVGAVAVAGRIGNFPFGFSPGGTIKASEMTANFDAVKVAVNDSQDKIDAMSAKIAALEAAQALKGTCAAGQRKIGDECIETGIRPGEFWNAAGDTCIASGGHLCRYQQLAAACKAGGFTPSGLNGAEYTADVLDYTSSASNFNLLLYESSPNCLGNSVGLPSGLSYPFRCCYQPRSALSGVNFHAPIT